MKNPDYMDRCVMRDGAVLETEDGSDIISVSSAGVASIKANIEDALAYGSIYLGDVSGVTSELAIGTVGQVLTSNGTTASWSAASTGNTLNEAYDQGGAGAGRTITADTGAVTVTNATSGVLLEVISSEDAVTGAGLALTSTSATPAANDEVGRLSFYGEDDGSGSTEYSYMTGVILDPAAGAEFGMTLFYAQNGTAALALCGGFAHDGSYGEVVAGDGAAEGVLRTYGNYDLILKTGNATTGTFTITDGANGDMTFAPNGTGDVVIASDSSFFAIGASGVTDSYLRWDATGSNLVFYDSTVGAERTLSQLTSIAPSPTISGDVTISDGKLDWTNASDEVAGTWSFTGAANNDIDWASSVTSANALAIVADSLTTGTMVYLESSAAGMNGEYIRCYDGAADDFSVGVAGLTTIAGTAAGTDVLVLTTGDLNVTDTDASTMSSVNGTTTLLTLDNAGGAIGDNEAVLTLDAGGTPAAAGSNILRVEFNGTDTNKPTLVEVIGAGKDCMGLSIDADPTTTDVVLIHSDAVIAADKAMITLDHATGASAAGSGLLRITESATPNAGAIGLELDLQQDMIAVSIDTNAATNDAFYVTHSGNLAAGKAVMHVTDGGTPAADNVYVGHFAFTGTDTAESVVLFADGGGKDVVGLLIDVDPVYDAAGYAGHLTMYSNAAGDLPVIMSMIHEDAGAASGEYCARMYFYGSDDAAARELYASIEVEMDDASAADPDGILWIKADQAGTNNNVAGFGNDMVQLGAAAATLTTAGAWDLTISTALTAGNEPNIVLTDGASGNITLTAGGTDGEIDLASNVLLNGTETIAAGAGGALTLTVTESLLETDGGGDAYTLAAGVVGQVKLVTLITHGGGNGVLTLTGNPAAYDVITFTAVGQSALLKYNATGWMPISLQGCTIA